jgi:hypothetical protein
MLHTSPATAAPDRFSVLALVVGTAVSSVKARTDGCVTFVSVIPGVNAPPLRLTMTRPLPSPMAA